MSDNPPPIPIPEDDGAEISTGAGSLQPTVEVPEMLRATLAFHSGPLPHPEQLREYDKILPGAAERCFAQFEKQADHRREMESLAAGREGKLHSQGQTFAFLITTTGIVGGLFLLFHGKSIEGLAALVTAFAWTSALLMRRRRGGKGGSTTRLNTP